MSDLKLYPEGTPFTGRIGRTAATSEPAWPQPPLARAGAPNVLVFLLDDVGFAQLGCYGADIRTPTKSVTAGLLAFVLTVGAELGLALVLQDRSLGEYAYDRIRSRF